MTYCKHVQQFQICKAPFMVEMWIGIKQKWLRAYIG